MSYRVVIPTAGIGSRLGNLTKNLNKSLISISLQPIISHLINHFPKDCEFVIGLGHLGNLVKDFLEIAYPNRSFFFGNVDKYEGDGSGLGLTLLSCKQYLQEPFIFLSCDTLVKETIPNPDHNWMGYSKKENLSDYRTLRVVEDEVNAICEKGVSIDNQQAYIGLAAIHDYDEFWLSMQSGKSESIHQGESYGMRAILKSKKIFAKKFTWFDTGNSESLEITRRSYSETNLPNILEKKDEAIWFVGNNVIKYSDNKDFINNRIERTKSLEGFVPKISSKRPNMYLYKKVKNDVLSEIITPSIFEDFLKICSEFWLKKKLDINENKKFQSNCLNFYKDKTFERLRLFYKNFNKLDNAKYINGELMPTLEDLLNQLDWKWISNGLAGRYHGDFHFENILYSNKNKTFSFLDWRQDFAGDLLIGDIYYDLAKLNHGLIVNHGIIAQNNYSASWNENKIHFELKQKKNLLSCQERLNEWIEENKYDLKKVRVLTGLIYLNISALHHFPYSILLYGLGKKILKNELI